MLFTVESAASKTLAELLTSDQEAQIDISQSGNRTKITLQVLGAQDVYVEHKATAAVASGIKLQGTIGQMDFELDSLDDLNLIADTTDNVDVRLITR